MNCRVCNFQLVRFLSLGQMPLVNSFLRREEFSREERFDLSVGFCPNCYLVQLLETVSPEKLFKNYLYLSSTSRSFLEHCQRIAEYLAKRLKLTAQNLVLEIASNDGAQLQYFKALGISVLGIEPAENVAGVANQRGIDTIPEFFNYNFAVKLRNERGLEADLVFGANVLAHVPAIVDFVKGVKTILKPKGSAVFEFPYLRGLMENKFDTIYHEHVFYYSLVALINLFKKADLEIYDVEMTPMQGGSLLLFVAHPKVFPVGDKVKNLAVKELSEGFDKIETYQGIGKSIEDLKSKLVTLLRKIKDEGKRIAAYGAAAKGNVLLNYCGIDEEYLDFVADKSKLKQGLYTPGAHLPVQSPEKIYQEKPDYLLILPWNIADEVVTQLKDYREAGGKFIIPIPELKIV